jgi:hypothetical protein
MSDLEPRLLARAEALDDDMPEVAGTVTVILAAARAARLDPDALGGLVGAALALGADQIAVYTAGSNGEPSFADETLFAAAVSDAEDDAEDLRRAALRLRSQVRAARGTARLALAAAYLMPTRTAEQRAARAAAIAAAKQRIAFCNEALNILAAMINRLDYALRRLRGVPAELGETYESVYTLIRSGGQMPYDGDFITGGTEQERTG